MHKNYFDIVMAHIEENVDKPAEEIKRQIPLLIGRNGRGFGESFALLTGYPLGYYIKQRQLLYAVRDLLKNYKAPIAQIASQYQFSDQAAFSRAVKAKYHFTPSEIREKGLFFDEEPCTLSMFTQNAQDSRTKQILRSMELGGPMDSAQIDLMLLIDEVNKDFELDWDTCCLIMELAERMDVPFVRMYDACTAAWLDARSDNEGFVSEMDEIQYELWLKDMGVESEQELKEIGSWFHCAPGMVSVDMVARYREHQKKEQ